MRGRAAERALGVGVSRLPEIKMAEREIGLRPRGLELKRLVEAFFGAGELALARQQDADVVMDLGQRRLAPERAAIIG
jgi:hypothetical protein